MGGERNGPQVCVATLTDGGVKYLLALSTFIMYAEQLCVAARADLWRIRAPPCTRGFEQVEINVLDGIKFVHLRAGVGACVRALA